MDELYGCLYVEHKIFWLSASKVKRRTKAVPVRNKEGKEEKQKNIKKKRKERNETEERN
jgi:hypothetical protein